MISQNQHTTLEALCRAVAVVHGIEVPKIVSEDRTEPVATARQFAIFIAERELDIPRHALADFFQRGESYISQVMAQVYAELLQSTSQQIVYKERAILYLLHTELKWKGRL